MTTSGDGGNSAAARVSLIQILGTNRELRSFLDKLSHAVHGNVHQTIIYKAWHDACMQKDCQGKNK